MIITGWWPMGNGYTHEGASKRCRNWAVTWASPYPALTPDPSPEGRGEPKRKFWGGACLSGVCAAHEVRRTHTEKSDPPFLGECEACPKGDGSGARAIKNTGSSPRLPDQIGGFRVIFQRGFSSINSSTTWLNSCTVNGFCSQCICPRCSSCWFCSSSGCPVIKSICACGQRACIWS